MQLANQPNVSHHHNSHVFPPNEHTMAQPRRTHPIRRNSGRIERKWETEQNKKYNDKTREKQFQLKYLIVWLLGDNINFAPINMLRVHYLYHFTKIPNDSNIKAVELLSWSYFALVNYFSALFSAIEKPNYSPKSVEHFNGFWKFINEWAISLHAT